MQRDNKHNANAVPLPPDEACNADPAHAHLDLEGGEGEVVNVARACQEEATVARASPPPPLTLQSIINFLSDEATATTTMTTTTTMADAVGGMATTG